MYGAADIYHDFVYPGGCANGLGASAWAALMLALELTPPSLQDPEGGWLDAWRQRLERLDDGDISSLVWPSHRDHDEYWRSRIIPVEDIEVPAFFVSGWRDLLCEGMMNAYGRCRSTKQLLVGPWTHAAPDSPGEAPYDWLEEIAAWWDRWLKDVAPAVDRAPVVYYLQADDSWHTADAWPPDDPEPLGLHPGPDGVLGDVVADLADRYDARSLVGTEAGLWYPMGITFEDEFDQRRDDAKSLSYTSAPLPDGIDVARRSASGAPDQCRDHRRAQPLREALRRRDEHGGSTLISSGWRRVTADDVAAGRVDAEVVLYPTAYRVAPGHRLRWTVACADFPRLWPTPVSPVITVHSDAAAPSTFCVPRTLSRTPTGRGPNPWTRRST